MPPAPNWAIDLIRAETGARSEAHGKGWDHMDAASRDIFDRLLLVDGVVGEQIGSVVECELADLRTDR